MKRTSFSQGGRDFLKKILLRTGYSVQRLRAPAGAVIPQKFIADAVQEALTLQEGLPEVLPVHAALQAQVSKAAGAARGAASRALFSQKGRFLPCWLEGDLLDPDGWLLSPRYFPVYWAIFQGLAASGRTRMLEIGVRTGYTGVCFVNATKGRGFYCGVDPDLYVLDGLERAAESFRSLQKIFPSFDFCLLKGYSWEKGIQETLVHTGPFDVVHIDGDHSLLGKLIDLDLAARVVRQSGCVLVDDYDHHASTVRDALRRAWHAGWYRRFAYVPTLRGLAVLQRVT